MSDKQLRDTYRGLWKIEETFQITKSDLKTRPVYVWTRESIEAHFLTCFVSLVMLRLLQKRTNDEFSTKQIIDSLKNYNSAKINHEIYLQNFRNQIIEALEKKFNLDLSRQFFELKKIKSLLK